MLYLNVKHKVKPAANIGSLLVNGYSRKKGVLIYSFIFAQKGIRLLEQAGSDAETRI